MQFSKHLSSLLWYKYEPSSTGTLPAHMFQNEFLHIRVFFYGARLLLELYKEVLLLTWYIKEDGGE
jgi:hypothetical protein